MRRLSLLTLLALGCAAGDPVFDGSSQPIVDGELESGYPEVVFLYNISGAACTATIISPRVVLTAKHCVQDGRNSRAAPASNFRVFVGRSARSATAQYLVSEVRPVPGRWDLQDGSDVAVLILSSPAAEAPREVSFDNPSSIVGQSFTAVGYGQTPSGGSGTKYSTEKLVRFVRNGFVFVSPAVCSGDSGGPLVGEDGRIWGVASFIYSESGGQPNCGTAPGAYNALNRYRDFIEQAIVDSGACVPSEEICNGIDDNCDEVVDEGCTATGDPCTGDDECVGGACRMVGDATSRICTLACDPLRPNLGCPADMYCATEGGGSCNGFCAPGGAGELPLEAECSADSECQSALCTDPGDGIRRCLAPCQGDGADCLAGEVCAAVAGSCGACVPEGLVAGLRGYGEPCMADEMCSSGLCFDDEGVSYCSRPCTDDAACGDGFHCREGTCARGPRESVGGGCVNNEDCESGICATSGDRRWCTDFCDPEEAEACPAGLSCLPAGGETICVPDLSLVGEACLENAECTTGLCAFGTRAGDVCTRLCDADNACSPGFECLRIDGGASAICVPAASATSGGGGGGCAAGGRGGLGGLLFALAGLMVLRRRR